MPVSNPLNIYTNDYAQGATDNFNIASVQANAGELIVYSIQYRDQGSNNVGGTPTWNGQNMTSTGPRANGYMWSQTWYVVASSTATASILNAVTDGGAFPGVALAMTFSGVTAVGAIIQQAYTSTYANPSLTSGALASGDLLVEILNASGYDAGFGNTIGVTWAETNTQTRRATITGVQTSGNLIASTKTGTGALTVGYTPTGGNPAYVHTLLPLSSTPPTTIDTVTTGGVSGLKVNSGFAITTTGLGNLTNVEIKTAATTAAKVNATSLSAFAGDGNAIMPPVVIGGYYPFLGTVTITATDGPLSAITTRTLSWDNYLNTIFSGLVTSDATYLAKVLSDAGHPLAEGEMAYYTNANSLMIGSNSSISVIVQDGESVEVTVYIHKLSGIIEAYKLTISDAGEIIDIDPLGKQKRRRYLATLYTARKFYRNYFRR